MDVNPTDAMDFNPTIVGLDAMNQLLLPDHKFRGGGSGDPMTRSQKNFKIDINISGTRLDSRDIEFVSGDCVNGIATVSVDKVTTFDKIEVVLQGKEASPLSPRIFHRETNLGLTIGVAQTRPPQNAPQSGHVARRAFLILPNSLESSTDDSMQSAEQTTDGRISYRLNFSFVIPHKIPRSSRCSHPKNELEVWQAHSLLLPTFGAPWAPNYGATPDTTRIAYAVFVRVFGSSQTKELTDVLAVAAKELVIMPIISEHPALDSFLPKVEAHRMVEHRSGQQTGKLSARLNGAIINLEPTPSTLGKVEWFSVQLDLRYIAKKDEPPPQLGPMDGTLLVHTFYGTGPFEDIPDQWLPKSYEGPGGGTVFTFKRPMKTIMELDPGWDKDDPYEIAGYIEDPSEHLLSMHRCKATKQDVRNHFYTSNLRWSMKFPPELKPLLAPTFHSCIISRTYSVQMDISYAGSSRTGPMTIHAPVIVKVVPRMPNSAAADAT